MKTGHEKQEFDTVVRSTNTSDSDLESLNQKKTKLKAVQRKIDIRILLWYSFVYLVLSIHKTNIANTAIVNVETNDDILTQLGDLSSSQ